jgi:glycosyltransferase involved in cell wall biosynthesis
MIRKLDYESTLLEGSPMKVSVFMLAYKHEKFIAQALDSVLMQQVNFDYEIVIGEDCSPDTTRDILISYQQEHPEKIRLLLPEKNLGMHDNFIQTFKACRGNYIAILEGDDYWTSPYKLQKQVDFLDTNADCTICFHKAFVPNQDGSPGGLIFPKEQQNKIFTLEDILSCPSNMMPTASIMFRQGFINEFPDWTYDVDLVDWTLQVLLAQHGNIGFLDEVLSVYRVHPEGNWSRKSHLEATLELTKVFQCFSKYLNLNSKNKRIVRVILSDYYGQLAILYAQNGDRKNSTKYISKWFLNDLINKRPLSRILSKVLAVIKICTPSLYQVIKKIKYRFFANKYPEKKH